MPRNCGEDGSVVVTSPPFNLGIRYNSYEDDLPWEEYLDGWIGLYGNQAGVEG